MPTPHVFISYARRDYMDDCNRVIPNNIVSRVQNALRDAGISYWIDEEGLLAGDTFPVAIAQQIQSCKVFLFISTENSNQSPWVVNEVATAHYYNKPILPFRYDATPFHTGLMIYIASLQYIDYPSNPHTAIAELVTAIKRAIDPSLLVTPAVSRPQRPLKPFLKYLCVVLAALLLAAGTYFGVSYNGARRANKSEVIAEYVYITAHGECYHLDTMCHTIRNRNFQSIPLDQAIQLSKRPCSFCVE